MRRYPAVVLRRATGDTQRPRTELCQSAKREFWPECHRRTDTLVSKRSVCYDYQSCGEVSERLKELASKASVGGTLPWVQIPPSPPFVLCQGSYTFQIEAALRLTFHERIQQRLPQEQNSIRSQTSAGHQAYGALVPAGLFRPYGIGRGGSNQPNVGGGGTQFFEGILHPHPRG